MKRVTQLFARLRDEKKCGLIAYVTCGYPSVAATVEIVRELVAAGADAIELGIPFSDPIADGPVIQASSFHALQGGTNTEDVLQIARSVREGSEVPLIAFSYLNPIARYGAGRFATRAAESGIDAALITDLPLESLGPVRDPLHAAGIGTILLATPTTPPARLTRIARMSDGFVYYVSTTGVTGTRRELDPGLLERVRIARDGVRGKSLAVGFGVSTRDHFSALSGSCDAVVVGSAIVRAIGDAPEEAAQRAAAVVREIKG